MEVLRIFDQQILLYFLWDFDASIHAFGDLAILQMKRLFPVQALLLILLLHILQAPDWVLLNLLFFQGTLDDFLLAVGQLLLRHILLQLEQIRVEDFASSLFRDFGRLWGFFQFPFQLLDFLVEDIPVVTLDLRLGALQLLFDLNRLLVELLQLILHRLSSPLLFVEVHEEIAFPLAFFPLLLHSVFLEQLIHLALNLVQVQVSVA